MVIRWPSRHALHLYSLRVGSSARRFSVSVPRNNVPEPVIATTRNIGIIAHIDAGKTTTTERMLFYSGFTRRLGDVDEGSTVTDFLPAERARGITIQSAAITFSWPPVRADGTDNSANGKYQLRSDHPHNINLIDTPGHADFTFEVLRSLRILDGAVCILDGIAGVEAQTEQVWAQASHYHIPRILFVNKLDRDGAAFARTIREIGTRLHSWPAICQIPWWTSGEARLQGVGDVVALKGLLYEQGSDGRTVSASSLFELEKTDPSFAQHLKEGRIALVELLSEHDDEMVETFLECEEDHLAIPQAKIVDSLRKVTLASPQRIVPVFSGASFRNVGVQPLLDAVVNLLPTPMERPEPEARVGSQNVGLERLLAGDVDLQTVTPTKSTKGRVVASGKAAYSVKSLEACALAFKVVTDPRRGVLVYVRVYSGCLTRNAMLFNTNLQVTEKAPRLLRMHANDAVEVERISAGQIGVITGLKHARTGDTLIVYTGANPKIGPPAPLNSLQLRPIAVPPPVFFTSVEPNSLAEQKHLGETLSLLLREDPSLSVTQDLESGQTHLAGMGELHLQIAVDRLINDLKAKARIGSIQIGYREAVTAASSAKDATFDRDVAGKASKAACTASVSPLDVSADHGDLADTIELSDNNHLTVRTPMLHPDGSSIDPETPSLPANFSVQILRTAFHTGASAALARGPSHGYAMHSTRVIIDFDPAKHLFSSTTPAALSSAARLAVTAALRDAAAASDGTTLMEPVMRVTISVNEESLGDVVHDLTSARGGQVISLGGDDGDTTAAEDESGPIDPSKIWAPPDPFAGSGRQGLDSAAVGQTRQIVARVPLKEMVGYLKHLRSLTGGRGTFVMAVNRFEGMSKQRMKAALAEMRGEYV